MGVKNTKAQGSGEKGPSTPSKASPEQENSGAQGAAKSNNSSRSNILSGKKSSFGVASQLKDPGIYGYGKVAPIKAEAPSFIPILSLNSLPLASMNSTHLSTFVITDEGKLFSFGLQLHGELGIGSSEKPVAEATLVSKLEDKKVIAVACGYRHVLALTDAKKLFAWGSHEHKALGIGDTTDNTFPSKVTGLKKENVTLIAAGFEHSIAYTESGSLYVWGSNSRGQLGISGSQALEEPTVITKLSSVKIQAIYAHAYMNIVVTDTWQYYVWGENKSGNLGVGSKEDKNKPVELQALSGIKVKTFAMGRSHVLALTEEGEVYGWGSNSHKQLGIERSDDCLIPTKLPVKQAVDIGASDLGSAILSVDNEVFVFGKELIGESKRAIPEIHPQLVGVQVRGMHLSYNRLFVFVS